MRQIIDLKAELESQLIEAEGRESDLIIESIDCLGRVISNQISLKTMLKDILQNLLDRRAQLFAYPATNAPQIEQLTREIELIINKISQ